jgi:3-oxoacyl-[acyl-carrier protein] reductase
MEGLGWNMAGRLALVTGGSRGIGRAICRTLASAGCHVVIGHQASKDAAESVSNEIQQNGGSCEIKRFNVADLDQVQGICQEILEAYGRIDLLVNNAGIARDQLFVRMKPQDWQQVLDVNLTGAYNCARCVAKSMMKRREGCIVNMASIAGIMGNAGQANYSASKAGLIGLTKALARELAPWRIRVNAVAPGYIETDMTDRLPSKVKEEVRSQIPLGRFGNPEDVAWTVLFLSSPASDYVTGQVLNVSGGLYLLTLFSRFSATFGLPFPGGTRVAIRKTFLQGGTRDGSRSGTGDPTS